MGYDAGKKVKGRKRHAIVDTLGLMLGVDVLPVDIQDRDGCLSVLKEVRRLFPFLQRIVADGGYQGRTPQPPFARPPARRSRSSNGSMPPRASSPFPSAGSSNAPSAGLTAAGGSPETSSAAAAPTSPSFTSP